MNRIVDLSGRKFGRLYVPPQKPRRVQSRNETWWKVYCDCGNREHETTSGSLKSGDAQSCGCLRNQLSSLRQTKPYGESACRTKWGIYKFQAKERGIPFALHYEVFKSLTKQNCRYCGTAPSQIAKKCYRVGGTPYVYNGIDRIDNDQGYTVDNCVACCKTCNGMKSNHDLEFFLRHIRRILVVTGG